MPCTRQVPNREARVILLWVPFWERVPRLIFRLTTRLSEAALGRVVVRGHFRLGHEDEESPDVALDTTAQLGWYRRRVVEERSAECHQLSFQSHTGGVPLLFLGERSEPAPTVSAASASPA